MKELVEYIAKALVDHPDQVRVNQIPGDQTVVIELEVAPDDMGKVIGKEGRIANAIRSLLKVAAAREGKRAILEIVQRRRVPPSDSPEQDAVRFLDVGRVVAPFGLAGELRVMPMTDFPERFAQMERVLVGEERRPFRISRVRGSRGQVILKLRGVDDVDAAEALRNTVLRVPISEAIPLADDQYFWYQIIDLEVVTTAGSRLGRVIDILPTGANDVYVVRGPRGDLLIPAIEDVVKEVDLKQGRLVVELMPGLVDEAK